MPLIFSTKVVEGTSGSSFKAKDANSGVTVIVVLSMEVTQDFGIEDAMRLAEKKYDSGMLEDDGSILVRPSDFSS
jgi:hypothetical protein